ncbi:hypothetical protein [Catellatospora sp. NPDC049609]|uniref:hypothetical protein n=1 Tax=Catellatospora sp. NPDC049609 TaxID=3155505 RepID=UPI00343EC95C
MSADTPPPAPNRHVPPALELRRFADSVDEVVDAVTDGQVEERLSRILATSRAGKSTAADPDETGPDSPLVRVMNGRLVFGAGVAAAVELLAPLGEAACVAESVACALSARVLGPTGEDPAMSSLLEAHMSGVARTLGGADVTAGGLRQSLTNLQGDVLKPALGHAQRMLYFALMRILSDCLVRHHAAAGGAIAGMIDAALRTLRTGSTGAGARRSIPRR